MSTSLFLIQWNDNDNVGKHPFRLKYKRKGAGSGDYRRNLEWKIKLECNSEVKNTEVLC